MSTPTPQLIRDFQNWNLTDLRLILTPVGEVSGDRVARKVDKLNEAKAILARHSITQGQRTAIQGILDHLSAHQQKPAQKPAQKPSPDGKQPCQCLTQKGTDCPYSAQPGSRFCKRHADCQAVKGTVSPQQVVEAARKRGNERLAKVFAGHKASSDDEKERMASQCPECCGLVIDGKCKYPLCKEATCDRDCSRVAASTTAARIQKGKGHLTDEQQKQLAATVEDMCRRDPACGDCQKVFK
jgi:hypothetical protein